MDMGLVERLLRNVSVHEAEALLKIYHKREPNLDNPPGFLVDMFTNPRKYLAHLSHAHVSREISQTHSRPCLRCGRPFTAGQGWKDGCHLDPDCAR